MPRVYLRCLVVALALPGATLTAAPACAAQGDAQIAAARDLFVQAEKDEDAGRWADAIDKLRRVFEVKATAGVRYHLALCEEHTGHLAAALDDYAAAEEKGRAENARDVLRLVGTKLAELAPRVPRLTLRLVPDVAGAVVKVDGNAISPALVGSAMPVDPGMHQIEATAPEHLQATAAVTMQESDAIVLDLRLPDSPPPPPAVARDAPADVGNAPGKPGHAWAIAETAGAVALAAVGVGGFVAAGSAHGDAVLGCARTASSMAGACDSQKSDVRRWDWIAAGAWAGSAALATVAVLSWTRTAATTTGGSTSARVVVGFGSLDVEGSF